LVVKWHALLNVAVTEQELAEIVAAPGKSHHGEISREDSDEAQDRIAAGPATALELPAW